MFVIILNAESIFRFPRTPAAISSFLIPLFLGHT